MHTLIELIAGLVALLAAAALTQFGVDMNAAQASDREVRRISDCSEPTAADAIAAEQPNDC